MDGSYDEKTPVETVELYYTGNAETVPVTWNPIASFNPEDCLGTYPWPVPEPPTVKSKCKAEVILRDINRVIVGSDASDGVFTIQPQEP